MNCRKFIISYFFILLPFAHTIGQEKISFDKLNKLNGLSNNTVNDIKQDTSGYIWIATNKGLNRFDGKEFKTYQSSNSAVLRSDYIRCLEIDSQNRLWFGTSNGGVYYLNINQEKLYSIADKLQDVNNIHESENGRFWIGARSGLYELKQGNQGRFTLDKISNLNVQVIKSQAARLWLGTSNGVYYLDQTDLKVFPIPSNYLADELVFDIEIVNRELWIATRHSGVVIYSLAHNEFISIKSKSTSSPPLDFKDVRFILKGSNDKLYIGTDGAGLVVYDVSNQNVDQYLNSTNSNCISSNTIFSIYEDDRENIWLGHIRKGISIINNDKDEVDVFYRENTSDEFSAVLSIYQEENGEILCGTDGNGIFKIDHINNRYEAADFNAKLKNTYVQSIFRDSKNRLWIGTFSKGFFIQESLHKIQKIESKANDVRGFCEDLEGNIWIATNGQGLFKYDLKGRISQFIHNTDNPNTISSNYILSISYLDSKIYLATNGGGLNIFDVKTNFIQKLTQNEESNSILGNNLICLHLENEQSIWLGSTLGITNIIDTNSQQKFIRYSFDDLSFSRFILGILVDDNGEVWISTDEGIFNLDKTSGKFSKINLGASFNDSEFYYNSCYKSEDGKLYFGGVKGLFSFYPDRILPPEKSNKAEITGFEYFGKDNPTQESSNTNNLQIIKKEKHITVDALTSLIQIDFASIHLPSSVDYKYEVLLKNHDDTWQNIGNSRSVSYDNLSSGDYIFKVRSINAFSRKVSDITQFKITVLAPFWRTGWAILLYLLLLGLIFNISKKYFIQWKVMKQNLREEKLNLEKESALRKMQVAFFTNISHDLRTPLTLIMGNIRRLVSNQGQTNNIPKKELNVIENNINSLLILSNELLDFRKIETGNFKLSIANENINLLVKEVYFAFCEHAAERNIQFNLKNADQDIFISYDYDQLEKVFFNLITNAFKFTTSQGEINLIVDNSDPKYYKVAISNTGKVLTKNQQSNIFNRFYQNSESLEDDTIGPGVGIGLSIVKDIIHLHGGKVEVDSTEGVTTFTIYLKREFNSTGHLSQKEDHSSTENIVHYTLEKSPIGSNYIHEKSSEFRNALILVVEDNFELRKFIVSCLASYYQVLEAENGKQALELALTEIPDLILSDVMMPEMDGISLCYNIKTNVKISHIPVILLTARKSRYYKIKGLETGADEYISKPFNEEELQLRIINLLKVRKGLRERFSLEMLTKPEEVKLNGPDQKFITDLCEIIESNIDINDLNSKSISKELNMSHSLVYKKLKALTGFTLVEFIRDFRLQKAEMLLIQNKLTITEISYRVGFSDRHYFSTCFKKKYHMSPSEYAKIKKESASQKND